MQKLCNIQYSFSYDNQLVPAVAVILFALPDTHGIMWRSIHLTQ